MSKKMINPHIANELKGASAFFGKEDQAFLARADERSNGRSEKPNDQTVTPNGASERTEGTLRSIETGVATGFMEELQQRKDVESRQRVTRRYSFEIYADQIGILDEVKYLYRRQTGRVLSTSRILRDLIDTHLPTIVDKLGEESPHAPAIQSDLVVPRREVEPSAASAGQAPLPDDE